MPKLNIIGCIGICLAAMHVAPSEAEKLKKAPPYELSKEQIEAVERAIREDLKDPDSAKFAGVAATREPHSGMITVCGYVNAKNSYGSYTGKQLFYGLLEFPQNNFIPINLGGSPSVQASICEEAGIKF